MNEFDRFVNANQVLLTTYRRDGTPVATPVHIAVDGGRAYARTYAKAWKWRRVRNHPGVELQELTGEGGRSYMTGEVVRRLRRRPAGVPEIRVDGPVVCARGRILEGEEARQAARRLSRKYPMLHGWLIPLGHRLMRTRTIHMEFTASAPAPDPAGRRTPE